MNSKKIILIQLNEINFDFFKKYAKEKFNNLNYVFSKMKCSISENSYEKLEPWIQWVSVYSGKSADQHGVFRLGDVVNSKIDQIYEIVESRGYEVGAIMPMNAVNRLKKPSYFLPDPWTQTVSDNSFWSKMMTKVFSQIVNDNSNQKISITNYFKLLMIFFKFFRLKNSFKYLHLFLSSIKFPYRKAFFLDLLIHDIHMKLLKKKKANFSTIFFNAGAHIQHHYFFNSINFDSKIQNPEWYLKKNIDPIYETYLLYENIIGDYLKLDSEIIISTGLSQVPATETKFYYRLKNHKEFFQKFNLKFKNIYPRMTRDFLLEFDNHKDLENCVKFIDKVNLKNRKIFDYDIRDKSLFVTLVYSSEIKENFLIKYDNISIDFYSEVVFVALKNGIHHTKGYNYFTKNLIPKELPKDFHIKSIFNLINNYFNER